MQAAFTTASGEAITLGSILALDETPSGDPPRFRRSFRLRFAATSADRLQIDAAAVRMDGRFFARNHDAFGSGSTSDVRATVSAAGGALVVTAPAPARVRRVKITPATGQTGQIKARLLRMDGDVPAKEFTIDAVSNTVFGGDFTDRRFAIRATHGGNVFDLADSSRLERLEMRGFPTGARLGLRFPGEAEPTFFMVLPGERERGGDAPSGDITAGAELAEALQRGLDALPRPLASTIDVVLVAESDAPCRYRPDAVVIPYDLERSTFRAALLRSTDIAVPAAVMARLREGAEPVAAFLRSKLSAGVRDAVDRAIVRRTPSRSLIDAVVADLNRILQTEALFTPARFADVELPPDVLSLTASNPQGMARTLLNRRLLDAAYPAEIVALGDPADEEKQVLRDADEPRQVTVDAPRQAVLRSAVMRVSASLKPDAPAAQAAATGAGAADPQAVDWDEPLVAERGAAIDLASAAAREVVPAATTNASGVALAVLPVSTGTELIVELRDDAAGMPAGRVLGAGRCALGALDHPVWAVVSFAEPVVLSTQRHWIVARAAAGAAVWLAAEGPGETRIGDRVADGRVWKERGTLDGLAALYQLRSRTAPGATAAAAGAAAAAAGAAGGEGENGAASGAGAADARFRVRLAGLSLVPSPVGDDIFEVDLTAALQAHLESLDGAPGELAAVALRFTTVGRGLLTVYPPVLRYSL